jgi:hypothetical protein
MNVPKLIDDVRREHDLRLSPDDPILVSAFLAEEALKECAQATAATLRAEVDRTTATMAQMVVEARTTAGVMIHDASRWMAERFKADATAAVQPLLRELQAERTKVEELSRRAVRAGWFAGGCAALAAAGLAPWLLSALRAVL